MKSLISLQNLTHAYWKIDAPEAESERRAEDLNIVFEDFNLELPPGIVSLMGENGIGKSTLLFLAGARLFPAKGRVTIDGHDSLEFIDAHAYPDREEKRNRLVSFIFQNMEFETDEDLGTLLETVQAQDPLADSRKSLLSDLTKALVLEDCLQRRLQDLSKGQLQRAIIGLAMSYGSKILMMDEPVFALEERHKTMAFTYLRHWCAATGASLYFTAHDIQLCQRFSDTMLLLHADQSYKIGPTTDICTPANLEAAYRAPMSTLYQKDQLYREMLINKQ